MLRETSTAEAPAPSPDSPTPHVSPGASDGEAPIIVTLCAGTESSVCGVGSTEAGCAAGDEHFTTQTPFPVEIIPADLVADRWPRARR